MKNPASALMLATMPIFLIGLLLDSSSAAAGGNCQAKLVTKSFACEVKLSNGPAHTDCFEFNSGGVSQQFDFFNLEHSYGCACDTTGSFKSPNFDNSASGFECVDDSGDQLNGKVKGNKISGQGTDEDGNSLIYTCTVGPSCG